MTLGITELLSRPASEPPRFSALLHEWMVQDAQAKIAGRLMEQSAESKLIQRLGRFTAGQSFEQISLDARVQLAMPGRYRIDFEQDRAPKSRSIICNGERLWTVYADRVGVKKAKPLPPGLSLLADLSWLLDGHEITSEGRGGLDGRETILLSAVPTDSRERYEGRFPACHRRQQDRNSRRRGTGHRLESAVAF